MVALDNKDMLLICANNLR